MKLRQIAERQMEEALESLQAEREAKYALKKELDSRLNHESMYNISSNLAAISMKLSGQTMTIIFIEHYCMFFTPQTF